MIILLYDAPHSLQYYERLATILFSTPPPHYVRHATHDEKCLLPHDKSLPALICLTLMLLDARLDIYTAEISLHNILYE